MTLFVDVRPIFGRYYTDLFFVVCGQYVTNII